MRGAQPRANDRRVAVVAVACVLAVALAVRVYPLLAEPETRRGGIGIFGDSVLYEAIGRSLAEGRGFTVPVSRTTAAGTRVPAGDEPVITRGPVYPGFIALVYRALGALGIDPAADRVWSMNAVRRVQAVIDAVTCLGVFALARALWPRSVLPALVAGLLAAVCPYTIFYTRALLKETVATSLLTWTMVAVTLALRDRRLAFGVAAGLGAGLLALCTPQFLPWAPIAAVVIVRARRGDGRAIATASVMLLVWALAIAPWTVRNARVFDRFIPISTGDLGYSLYLGTFESNTNWTGWNEIPDAIFASPEAKRAVLAERDRFLAATEIGSIRATDSDRVFRRLAFERFAADPIGCVLLGVSRLPRLWFQLYVPMYLEREASGGWFLCYVVLAGWAVGAAGRETRLLMLPVVVLFLYQNAVYLPLHVEPRQAVPVIPSLLALSGIGLARAAAWRGSARGAR